MAQNPLAQKEKNAPARQIYAHLIIYVISKD